MAKEASRMNDDTMAAPAKAPAAPLRVNPVLFKRTEHATTDWHHISDASFSWFEGVRNLWGEQDWAVLTLVLSYWFGHRAAKAAFGGSASTAKAGG